MGKHIKTGIEAFTVASRILALWPKTGQHFGAHGIWVKKARKTRCKKEATAEWLKKQTCAQACMGVGAQHS